MAFFPLICSLLVLSCGACATAAKSRTKAIVLFGDSYTDQSRLHSIENGTIPGKDYKEIFPPANNAANGGVQWPWYLGLYGNYTIWNYAVAGAACSLALTPQTKNVPDVISGQPAWFIQDHVSFPGTKQQRLDMDPDEFVAIIWIGTNDCGEKTYITDNQSSNVSLADVAHCQVRALRNLYALGARRFILNSMAPLPLTPLYSSSSAPSIYAPAPHNGTEWHKRMFNFANTMNVMLRAGVDALRAEWGPAAAVGFFDTYAFLADVYARPAPFFNGSVPANVTGHCNRCNPANSSQCTSCPVAERDSYMWWDELHPSEQTGRNLAREMFHAVEGRSKYLS